MINSTFTIWHYKFSIYYKFVIVIDLVYAQHVTEEHYTLNEGKVAAYKLVFLYVHLSLGFFSKRQLTFTFAICRRACVRLSSVCLSVCNVHAPYSGDSYFLQYFYIIRKSIYPSFLRRRMVGGGDPFYLKFWVNRPPFERYRRFSTDIRPQLLSRNT